MSDYQTPCQTGDAEDWFIGRDGKQYPDDSFVSDIEVQALIERLALENPDASTEEYDAAIDAAEEAAKRGALIRRRKAREACYSCYVRLQCLTVALDAREKTGTWGGYFEEQIREINRLRDERKKGD